MAGTTYPPPFGRTPRNPATRGARSRFSRPGPPASPGAPPAAPPRAPASLRGARGRGAVTIGLSGGDGGELAKRCDLGIIVPARLSPRVQAGHGTIIHIICELVEQALFDQPA